MNPAPYSKGMPRESPGQVAVWIGWNIVDEFMQNNRSYNFRIISNKGRPIHFNQSKYKP